MAIIEVNHVTKEYRLGNLTSLMETTTNMLKRLSRRQPVSRERFKALDDVDFKIEKGEVVGIIGSNGAGKSTLLKHLASITKPTRGEIIVRGSVAPLIEVGAGVNPELTGRENIYLNGAILGIPKKIIHQKIDDIISFAELEQFIDTPVKRYSSGMTVRLGFAIATSIDADILIVDEVLAVGDLAFQRKCFDRMEHIIKRQGKTVLLVSHNIRQVERICTRVILLDAGKLLVDGESSYVTNLFYERSDEKIKSTANRPSSPHSNGNGRLESLGEVELLGIELEDELGRVTQKIKQYENIDVVIRYKTNIDLIKPTFGIGVHTTDILYLATHNSGEQFRQTKLVPGIYEARCRINRFPFLAGSYSLRIGITSGELYRAVFYAESVHHFQVEAVAGLRSMAGSEGFVCLDAEWQDISIKPAQPQSDAVWSQSNVQAVHSV